MTFAVGPNAEWPMLATLTLQHGVTAVLENTGIKPPSTGDAGYRPGAQPLAEQVVHTAKDRRALWIIGVLLSSIGGLIIARSMLIRGSR